MSHKLSEADCQFAVEHGEFSQTVRESAPAVAVILTQSWCPQWNLMRSYLPNVESGAGSEAAVWVVEYDREPFYETFMTFKEDHFGNRSVPYVRYYRGGTLTSESNYISLQGFMSKLGVK